MVGRVLGVRSRVVGGGCVWWWSCVGVWRVGFGCFLSLCSADRRDWFWWLLCLFVRGYFSCVYLRGRFPHPRKKPTPLRNLKEGGNCELWLRSWYYTNRADRIHKLLRVQLV